MKLPIRYFAIGILTASLVITISLYFFDNSTSDLEDESIENITSFLENEGYRVITEDEYISYSVNGNDEHNEDDQEETKEKKSEGKNQRDDQKEEVDEQKSSDDQSDKEKDEKKDEPKEDKKKEKIHKYTLTIEPNMLAPEVGELLVNNKIIDSANDFVEYLEEKGYSQYIQLGKHEVTSKMDFYELAETITNN